MRIIDQREQVRADFLQTQLFSAAVLEESADVMDKSTQEYQDTLVGAAEEYRAVYEKYRTRLAGLYARMYQGRSLQKIGRTAEALKCYEELLGSLLTTESSVIFTPKVLLLAIYGWQTDSQKNYAQIVQYAAMLGWAKHFRLIAGPTNSWP